MTKTMQEVKRLYKLSCSDIEDWRKERLRVGQTRYGDRDQQRYGLLDVMEELLDCINILERTKNRLQKQGTDPKIIDKVSQQPEMMIRATIATVLSADMLLSDKYCTDENGGDRIWWYDQ